MNFLDTYGIAGPSAIPDSQYRPEQNLNEEVSEVIGQLGRFWGGLKKQSHAALQTARKDLTEVVTQAQKELTKLTSEPLSTERVSSTEDDDRSLPDGSATSEAENPEPSSSTQQELTSTRTQSLFSRLQSALPPNILETARIQLPGPIRNASENLDLPQLRTSLLTEIQRVQGVTRVHAEEYAHKSEAMLRGVVKEAGEVLRDAVKILPPEDRDAGAASTLVWDGGDIWTLQLELPDTTGRSRSQSAEQVQQRGSDAQNAVTTRADSLLLRLKQDPAIIRRDPSTDVDLEESYPTWIASEYGAKQDDTLSDEWSARISALLNEAVSGEALKNTRDTLVPSELTETEFWKRFFFRVHQIKVEEERRRAILEGTFEEEEFSWEDDDEEKSAIGEKTPPLVDTDGSTLATPLQNRVSVSVVQESSSEEGYDVVSSGTMDPRGLGVKMDDNSEKAADDLDVDSDWE